jgi:hypothetical protein
MTSLDTRAHNWFQYCGSPFNTVIEVGAMALLNMHRHPSLTTTTRRGGMPLSQQLSCALL